MKIAHLINPWLPVTQNWIYNQIVYNKECEHIVLCRTLENENQFKYKNVFAAHPNKGLNATLSMLIARARAQYPTGYYSSIIKNEHPDILHGHFAWESWRNIKLIKNVKLPLVTTFYGLDVNKHPRKNCWRKRYEKLFKTGTLFTVEGSFMGKSLAKIGCPEEKIRIIYLGVDIESLQKCKRTHIDDNFNILFVGLSREKKGGKYAAEAFVNAAQHNDKLRLHIIGNGLYRKKVQEIIENSAMTDRVTFHGYVPVARYHEILGEMDCILAPSVTAQDGDTEGGAPVSIIEAQAIGIPVIGSTHCDIPDIVKHNETGLLSAEKDVSQMIKDILLLSGNKVLHTRFSNQARIHISKQHDIHKQAEKLSEVYREAQHLFSNMSKD